ncbi:HAD-IA family hydrolase [Homoserinibacter sp. YIM 151385]|uniref:HAD-IA family hydrolase n=1 Tax=Homoserinibacter sp. YIM 151385 TaxID=2985506 RepID=UPI0022F143E9|nr:HAD-IA family hydrolase [Homoserinibacter sp. YIM 151385]WBU38282.1 HAD-IA family hydrolase [Homoserinibacter sp. YIM 151385]
MLLFVFDMDDVLYDYDWRHRMSGLSALTGHDLGELRSRWWTREGELAAEAGGFADGDAYLAAFNRALGTGFERADWVANRGGAMRPRAEAVEAVARAAELGQVTLLTNNGPLADEHLHELAPELVPVIGREHLRATSRYGARKPDPRVFERVLDAYGAPAASTFFADDLIANTESAASLGISVHTVRGPGTLRAAVEAFAASAG